MFGLGLVELVILCCIAGLFVGIFVTRASNRGAN